MSDVHSPDVRSRNMRAIRHKDTKPEILIRKQLHSRGFRYNLHDRKLPGKPDLVFPKYRAIIYVNGCFFHGHDCHLFKLPLSRREFWEKKISGNRDRDRDNIQAIIKMEWRVGVVWECSFKGKMRLSVNEVIDQISDFLKSDAIYFELSCKG